MKFSESFIKLLKEKVGAKAFNNTTVLKELGIDSLDFVEIILAAEEECGITFTNDEVTAFKTVGDVVTALDKKQK